MTRRAILTNLIWPDLQNHSEWGGGGGISESIHIFGVKYPGCQIIWQVTRASLFTARPSATVKALQAFADRHRLQLLHSQIVLGDLQPLSWEVNMASLCVKHLWQNSWPYIWSSTVGGPTRATAFHFHEMNLVRPKHPRTFPTEKRLMKVILRSCHWRSYQNVMAQIITARNCCENRIWAENKQISEQARKSLWLRKVPRPLLSRAVCFANKWTTKMYPALYPKPKGFHAQSSVKFQSSVLRSRHFLCGSKIIRRASLDPSIQNVHQNNHNHPKCPTLCLIFRETLYHCAHCGRGIAACSCDQSGHILQSIVIKPDPPSQRKTLMNFETNET